MSRYPTYVFPVDGDELRVVCGDVQYRPYAELRWQPRSHAQMVRSFKPNHAIWPWLRAHGYERTRSGPTQPESEREAKQVLLRLLPDDIARLDTLRGSTQRSAYVARLLRVADGVNPASPDGSAEHG